MNPDGRGGDRRDPGHRSSGIPGDQEERAGMVRVNQDLKKQDKQELMLELKTHQKCSLDTRRGLRRAEGPR